MTARTLSRRAKRVQHDQAEQAEQAEQSDDAGADDETPDSPAKARKSRARKAAADKPAKAKAPAKPRVRRKSVKAPPRMFARWAVCDNGLKRVAVFEFRDRADADARLAEMLGKKPGGYCLQLVKDPYVPVPDGAAAV